MGRASVRDLGGSRERRACGIWEVAEGRGRKSLGRGGARFRVELDGDRRDLRGRGRQAGSIGNLESRGRVSRERWRAVGEEEPAAALHWIWDFGKRRV